MNYKPSRMSAKKRKDIAIMLRKAAKKLEHGKMDRCVELMRAAYGAIFFR